MIEVVHNNNDDYIYYIIYLLFFIIMDEGDPSAVVGITAVCSCRPSE